MSNNTYNGWTNRATWLVNVWGNPESREDVRMLKEQLEEEYDAIQSGILKDMIDLSEINWEELEEACASDEEKAEDEEEPEDEDGDAWSGGFAENH